MNVDGVGELQRIAGGPSLVDVAPVGSQRFGGNEIQFQKGSLPSRALTKNHDLDARAFCREDDSHLCRCGRRLSHWFCRIFEENTTAKPQTRLVSLQEVKDVLHTTQTPSKKTMDMNRGKGMTTSNLQTGQDGPFNDLHGPLLLMKSSDGSKLNFSLIGLFRVSKAKTADSKRRRKPRRKVPCSISGKEV